MPFSKKDRDFRKSYCDYYPLILTALCGRVTNREDAEDICHEIFVTYYRKFEEVRDPRTWLFGAMKYSISNYYRNKMGSDSSTLDICTIDDDIHLAFENGFRDTRIIIHEAIENGDNYRNEKERILFELIAINNYTFDEAAKQLGLTRRQAVYKYQTVSRRILDNLKERGISRIEDLL
jgi:RNA polymerase sigma factor (sigma-70 family)